MRNFLLILLIILIGSCDEQTSVTNAGVKERKLDMFCDSFIISHKNWHQNNIINEEANHDLEKGLSIKISDSLLSDFPMKLYLINEYKDGKYAAHFSSDLIGPTYTFNFDVIALLSKSDIAVLKTDSLYGLQGHFVRFLHDDYKDYSYGLAYSPLVQIRKESSYDNISFDLGIILMDSMEIKRVNSE